MIVAIAPAGTGQVLVEEFREGADVAAAILAFCNAYTPPKNPADWVGLDTGWTEYQQPPIGPKWYYDHSTQALVVSLDEAKHAKCDAIDARTEELIAIGAEIPPTSGHFFSCDTDMQARIHGCYENRANLSYPVYFFSSDNLNKLMIVNEAGMENLLSGMNDFIEAQWASGDPIKDQVLACATVADVEAVVDPR